MTKPEYTLLHFAFKNNTNCVTLYMTGLTYRDLIKTSTVSLSNKLLSLIDQAMFENNNNGIVNKNNRIYKHNGEGRLVHLFTEM